MSSTKPHPQPQKPPPQEPIDVEKGIEKNHPITRQQAENIQRQVNEDQQRPEPNREPLGKHIPLSFDETISRISHVPPPSKK